MDNAKHNMKDMLGNNKLASMATETIRQATLKEDEMTFDDLQYIEKRRRAALRHNNENYLHLLFRWDGTVFRVLVNDALLYVTVIIYICVRIQARVGLPAFVESLSSSDIAIVGGFLSFFLVLFVNQSNARFWDQYNHAMKLKGRIFDIASVARANLPYAKAHRMVRYMNASMVTCYLGISDTYTSENFFHPLNKVNRYLMDEEVKRMELVDMDIGCAASRELVVWTLLDIQRCQKKGEIDNMVANQLREYVIDFRRSAGYLANLYDQPLSFFYVHFLVLLSTFYLPLFAINVGYNAGSTNSHWIIDIVTCLVVLLQAVFVIGLRLLGLNLSEPFGGDVEDLSVMHYSNFTWKQSNRILETVPMGETDEGTESNIRRTREKLGDAWDQHASRSIGTGKYDGHMSDPEGSFEINTDDVNTNDVPRFF